MSQRPATPEQVISAMSYDELQQLLSDLRMDSSRSSAVKLKRLVKELGQLEAAIEVLGGPATMNEAA